MEAHQNLARRTFDASVLQGVRHELGDDQAERRVRPRR
jgi:hypothetical protein